MAEIPSRKPKLVEKAKLPVQRESVFRIDRSPVNSLTRDAARLEYYKRRSLMEKIRNAFRTMSYRSEPTIGEEHLRCHDARVNVVQEAVDGKLSNKHRISQMPKDREKLPQTLLPDYFRHVQNFHHYRSDIESLQFGLPVLHLSPSERKDAEKERVLGRRYGHHDPGTERKRKPSKAANAKNHFHMLPCRKPIKSTRTTNGSEYDLKDSESSAVIAEAKGTNKRIVSKYTDTVKSVGGEVDDGFQRGNASGEDQTTSENKTNDADLSSGYPRDAAGIFNCRISLGSGRFPRAPLTTPDGLSSRSSIRTFHFSSQGDLRERSEDAAPTPSQSADAKSVFRASLAPFHSRFPQLKAPDSKVARTPFKRTPKIPDWQQYRILCDAFRPTVPYGKFHSQRNCLHYRKPRYVTSTELDYYIHIVTETNKTSQTLCTS